tara:strand:- start:3067 stop:4182 length:1116 start_codon:yes stop_codon:yes gene_type:complete
MTERLDLPPLYHRDSKGKVRVWRTWAEGPYVYSEAGILDGKQIRSKRRCAPTNVGRSNARTAAQQAAFEAQADWTNKVERKYSETIPKETDQLPLPMLAQPYYKKDGSLTSHAKKAVYPADVQPKFDGVRCIARRDGGEVKLFSRAGKLYDVPHVAQQLERWLPEGMELDGELYIHGRSLQQITSLVKRPRPESFALRYQVYDVPRFRGSTDVWRVRCDWLKRNLTETASVKRVHHLSADDEGMVRAVHERFVERGFEGAIVRLREADYAYGFRSSGLLKVKAFSSDEFEVVDCVQGVGKDEGTATFVCTLDGERTFKARMKGTLAERRAFWQERDRYIGERLTVEYFQLTDDGVPQFPVGVSFRCEEDLA